MIHYKPFPVFDIAYTKSRNWDIYLDGHLLAKESPSPTTDCALLAWENGYTGIYRIRRPESGRAWDVQGLIAAVAGSNLGTGIDSPSYGQPRKRPEKSHREVDS